MDPGQASTNGSTQATEETFTGYTFVNDVEDNEEIDWVRLGKEVRVYGYPIVISIGIVGNLISLALMQRSFLHRSTTSIYFSALAVADTVVLLFHLTAQWYLAYTGRRLPMWEANSGMCATRLYMLISAMAVSTWLMVAVTFERLIVTTFPFKGKLWCTRRVAYCTISLVTFFFPAFYATLMFSEDFSVRTYCKPTKAYWEFRRNVILPINLMLRSLIPTCLLILMNSVIIYQLIKARRLRYKLSGPKVNDTSTRATMIAVTVSVAYLVLTVPSSAITATTQMDLSPVFDRPGGQFANSVSLVIRLINHSINFFLFMFSSPKMRSQFFAMITCGRFG